MRVREKKGTTGYQEGGGNGEGEKKNERWAEERRVEEGSVWNRVPRGQERCAGESGGEAGEGVGNEPVVERETRGYHRRESPDERRETNRARSRNLPHLAASELNL